MDGLGWLVDAMEGSMKENQSKATFIRWYGKKDTNTIR
jgi:hypothetical protein